MVTLQNEGRQMASAIENPLNNLKAKIRDADLKHGEFAEAVGHAAGTISKYISGDIQIPTKELAKFAKVLNCAPMDIMYRTPPMPLLAVNRANFRYTYHPSHEQHKEHMDKEKMRVVWRFAAEYNKKFLDKCVYMDHSFDPNVMCVLWDLDVNHPDSPDFFLDHAWLDGCIEIVNFTAMVESRIDQNAINNYCYCMDYDNVLHYGLLYKSEPTARTWSLHSQLFPKKEKLNLRWACPSIAIVTRPELRNIRFETRQNSTSDLINTIERRNFLEQKGITPIKVT
tara:strand:+ start:108 stop:956 length:849 start_codon:yes stop_codon:yes gene_type:complete